MLAQMMKQAGPEYEAYVNRAEQASEAAMSRGRGRRESCVSVNIAWFDQLKWLRLAIAINVVYGCLQSVQNVRGELGGPLAGNAVTW